MIPTKIVTFATQQIKKYCLGVIQSSTYILELDYSKVLKRILNRLYPFRWTWTRFMFPFVNRIRSLVHSETTHPLDFCNIGTVNLEPVFLFNIFLYPLIGRVFGRIVASHIHRYLNTPWICSPRQADIPSRLAHHCPSLNSCPVQ